MLKKKLGSQSEEVSCSIYSVLCFSTFHSERSRVAESLDAARQVIAITFC